MTEADIKHQKGNFWVGQDKRGAPYVVYYNTLTHAESDSSYAGTEDGLSLAIARCDYLALSEVRRYS